MSYSGQFTGKKDSPTFTGLTLTGFSGVAKFVSGVFTGSSTTSDLPEGTNLYYTAARFTSAINALIGAVNGVAGLDASGKVPTSQLPASILGALKYQGAYDASTGVYPSSPAQGYYYIVSVAGTISGTVYRIGDWLTYDGSAWDKIDNATLVASVAGRTGAVVLAQADITGLKITDTPQFAGVKLTGASFRGVSAVSAAQSLTAANDVVLANGTFTLTLPTPVGNSGLSITVKNVGTGIVTVGTAAGLIDGASTSIINGQYLAAEFVSDGTNWNIL